MQVLPRQMSLRLNVAGGLLLALPLEMVGGHTITFVQHVTKDASVLIPVAL